MSAASASAMISANSSSMSAIAGGTPGGLPPEAMNSLGLPDTFSVGKISIKWVSCVGWWWTKHCPAGTPGGYASLCGVRRAPFTGQKRDFRGLSERLRHVDARRSLALRQAPHVARDVASYAADAAPAHGGTHSSSP